MTGTVDDSNFETGQFNRGNPEEGRAVYEKQCLRCHGEKLECTGPEGETLIVCPTNFNSVNSRSKIDLELLITIVNGALFPHMPYRDKLTDQQIIDVLSYIRAMAPTNTLS